MWRARTLGGRTQNPVAVKRMLFDVANDPEIVAMFVEEARVGLQLRHPNIVRVIDFGANEEDGYYLVMEWVEGLDLLDYMRSFHGERRHMPWAAVAAIGLRALHGLMAAHERKDAHGHAAPVIHRDLSPSNILLGLDGTVKIADFGLARAMDRATMTTPTIIKGKLSYTAPEVAAGQKANERTDIFSLGVTLWECLTGQRMFPGKSNLDVLHSLLHRKVPLLETIRPDVPAFLRDAVQRATVRKPMDRFPNARPMAGLLRAVLDTLPGPVDEAQLGQSFQLALQRLTAMDSVDVTLVESSSPRPRQPPPLPRSNRLPSRARDQASAPPSKRVKPTSLAPTAADDALDTSVDIEVNFELSPSSMRTGSHAASAARFDEASDEAPTLRRRATTSRQRIRIPSTPGKKR